MERATSVDIEGLQRRVRRSWYEDGVCELAAAAVMGVLTLFFGMELVVGREALPRGFVTLGLVALVLVGTAAAQLTVRTVRARLTYERSGYAARRRTPRSRRLLAAAIAVVANVLLVLLLRGRPEALALLPLIEGMAMAAFLAYTAMTASVSRLYWVAGATLACGALATLASAGELVGNVLLFGVLTTGLAASGLVALRRYLRETATLAGA
jgi:hypothetical protein